MKTSRYCTVINRGTVPTEIDRVLTVTVLHVPRIAQVLSPGLPRCRQVQAGVPRFYYVEESASRLTPVVLRLTPVVPDDCCSLHGYAPLFDGIESDSNLDGPGRHRGEPGRRRGKPGLTVAKFLRPVCSGSRGRSVKSVVS